MPTTIRSNRGIRVEPTAQASALATPHDWPKFAMTLAATCVLLVVLVLIRIG